MSRPSKMLRLDDNDAEKSLSYYLRHKLSEDCLVILFEYLQVNDLMRVCDLDTDDDQFFTSIIGERIIGKKIINLWSRVKRVWSLRKTIEKFGQFIKRLEIPLQLRFKNKEDEDLWPLQWTNLVSLNVTELIVENPVSVCNLKEFIMKMPHLEVFIWRGLYSGSEIGETLAKHCPKLRYFGDYCREVSTVPLCYDFLGNFEHLTQAVLISRSKNAYDLKSTLQILAKKNQLTELTIYQRTATNIESTNDEQFFEYSNGFSSLKTISFDLEFKDLRKHETFFRNIMTSLQGLEKIKMISSFHVSNISDIILFAPRIRELNIFQQNLHQMPVEVRHIRDCFRSIAEKYPKEDPSDKVRVVMNDKQVREFEVLKGIEKIIRIVVPFKKFTKTKGAFLL